METMRHLGEGTQSAFPWTSRHRRRVTAAAALLVTLALVAMLGAVAAASTATAIPQSHGAAPDPLALLAIQQAELIASDGAAGDGFGLSVALSGDTALVGAYACDVGGRSNQGAAWVFVRSGGVWTQQAKLIAIDGAEGDLFGISVALSGDTALVGARGRDMEGRSDQGAAYIFVRSGASWTQQAELILSDGAAGDWFGGKLALSGETAVIGARFHDVDGKSNQGAAWVFVRAAGVWTLQAELTASDGAADDWFGESSAVSGDTAMVGATGHDLEGRNEQGAAYVFTRSAGIWTQQAKLTASDGAAGDWFGIATALSGDGALVGARAHDVAGRSDQGAAYVFVRSGVSWSQQAELIAGDGGAGDLFGGKIALSGDAALVGARLHDVEGKSGQGGAYLFVRSGDTWTQQAELTATDGAAEDWFGDGVALSGETALVGAYGHEVGANSAQGAAYVFTIGAAPSTTATAATVKAGKTVKLKYVVNDPLPSIGQATVTIQIGKGAKVVRSISVGVQPTNVPLAYSFKAKLKKGVYSWRVLATDLAGNPASAITPAKLTVK